MRHQSRVKLRVSWQVARGATRRVQGRPVLFVGSLFGCGQDPHFGFCGAGMRALFLGCPYGAVRTRLAGLLPQREPCSRGLHTPAGSGPQRRGAPAGGRGQIRHPSPWYRQVSARSLSGFPNPACTSGVGNAQVAPGSGTLSGCHSSPSEVSRSALSHPAFLPPPRPALCFECQGTLRKKVGLGSSGQEHTGQRGSGLCGPAFSSDSPMGFAKTAAVGRWTGIQRPPQHDTTPRELRLVGILPCSRPQQETRDSSRRTTSHAETFEEFCAVDSILQKKKAIRAIITYREIQYHCISSSDFC
ncbi:uncharacterized protein LOC122240786 [Panthera tigris]|uniref:uncharacterized protein LOC122240786 n=1 Tax=Panthera tigris TaxID=9694 RepID=UPI001C6FACA7|nr:uncharacterized protein LOC122240786 [Panthera tigris]